MKNSTELTEILEEIFCDKRLNRSKDMTIKRLKRMQYSDEAISEAFLRYDKENSFKTVKINDLQNTLINNALVYLYHGIHDEDQREQILKLIKKFEFFSPDQE